MYRQEKRYQKFECFDFPEGASRTPSERDEQSICLLPHNGKKSLVQISYTPTSEPLLLLEESGRRLKWRDFFFLSTIRKGHLKTDFVISQYR